MYPARHPRILGPLLLGGDEPAIARPELSPDRSDHLDAREDLALRRGDHQPLLLRRVYVRILLLDRQAEPAEDVRAFLTRDDPISRQPREQSPLIRTQNRSSQVTPPSWTSNGVSHGLLSANF